MMSQLNFANIEIKLEIITYKTSVLEHFHYLLIKNTLIHPSGRDKLQNQNKSKTSFSKRALF